MFFATAADTRSADNMLIPEGEAFGTPTFGSEPILECHFRVMCAGSRLAVRRFESRAAGCQAVLALHGELEVF